MRTRLPFFTLLFFTSAILIYAAVRFLAGGGQADKIRIYSNMGSASGDIHAFLAQNAGKLQQIPSLAVQMFPNIEHISVRDNQNGTIDIGIKYKKIVGIWQNEDKFYPLLENGAHLPAPFLEKPKQGLVFRGALPNDITQIIGLISDNPDIGRRIDYMEYVDGRRWNIRLLNGATIMMPERNMPRAMAKIRTLGILDRPFDMLDLRDDRRALVIPRRQSGDGKN